eukprot:908739-Amphidinium_carterae.1
MASLTLLWAHVVMILRLTSVHDATCDFAMWSSSSSGGMYDTPCVSSHLFLNWDWLLRRTNNLVIPSTWTLLPQEKQDGEELAEETGLCHLRRDLFLLRDMIAQCSSVETTWVWICGISILRSCVSWSVANEDATVSDTSSCLVRVPRCTSHLRDRAAVRAESVFELVVHSQCVSRASLTPSLPFAWLGLDRHWINKHAIAMRW